MTQETPEAAGAPKALTPFAWWPVVGIAAALVVLMLFAGRYGYHRDELYFMAASKHMAWGFVDQPPLSVAVVWLARHLFGDSLYGLRLFPALGYATAVVLTGQQARELDGRRFAQIPAALRVRLGGRPRTRHAAAVAAGPAAELAGDGAAAGHQLQPG